MPPEIAPNLFASAGKIGRGAIRGLKRGHFGQGNSRTEQPDPTPATGIRYTLATFIITKTVVPPIALPQPIMPHGFITETGPLNA